MQFLDNEAELSDTEEVVEKQKKRTKVIVSDDEDSSAEEDNNEGVVEGLINDDIEEENDESDKESRGKRRQSSDDDSDLEDDDYDLLEENTGQKIKRKRRFKRLRRMSAGGSDEDERTEKEHIAEAIFAYDDDDYEGPTRQSPSRRSDQEASDSDNEEGFPYDDEDDFIVDDNGQTLSQGLKKKRNKERKANIDPALEEAREIFGVDFDYDEFDEDDQIDPENQEEKEGDEKEEEDEEEVTKKRKRKSTGKKIFEVYEPDELKKAFFTDVDEKIRVTDIPERMQLRSTPIVEVKDKDSHELLEEAEWIYKNAFSNNNILQKVEDYSSFLTDSAYKGPETVGKIRNALKLMRTDLLEVPFIAFYRKEDVGPELNVNDLWKIFKLDGKWCELRQRKRNLLNLIESMRDHQLEAIMKDSSAPLPDDIRVLKDQDIERVHTTESEEERKDVYNHFMLYYSREIPQLKEVLRKKQKEAKKLEKMTELKRRREEAEEAGEEPPPEDAEEQEEEDYSLKQAVRSGPYLMYRRAGLCSFAKKFGLTPEHFAENVRDNYQRREVEQDPVEPSVVAQDYIGVHFETTEQVLKAIQHMVAIQLAREPLIRKSARELYMERAKITVRPTKNGIKVIDESHQLYTVKYLKDKSVRDLVDHMWLKLLAAETDGLVTITFSDTVEGTVGSDFISEFSQMYIKDEFSKNVQEWNDLRTASVEMALKNYVIPDLKIELRTKMTAEAKEAIMYTCCQKLYNWIKFQPYTCTFPEDLEADMAWETTKGFRSIGIAYVPDLQEAAFASAITPDGACYGFLKMPHLLKRKNSFNQHEKLLKEADMLALMNFINENKPHVIVVAGESKEALMICDDVRECLTKLTDEYDFPLIQVELCDTNVAKIYSTSARGIAEFPEYPPMLRVAISLARRILNPLGEFAKLCNADEDLLCLRFHPLQDLLNKEDLLTELYSEFVNRVNEVGVEVNQDSKYTESLLQFISGLGPRKAQNMLKIMKHNKLMLSNRSELIQKLHFGPRIFINCAGFIKIDTSDTSEEKTDGFVEPLDGTRIHPETYEWARKMAVDALEDEDMEMDHYTATKKITMTPDNLNDLDLEAFAEELKRQGLGEKLTTLLDIRNELIHPYKDMRLPYESPSTQEIFTLLTKETEETFYVGKLVQATVVGFRYKKPEGEQLDQTNPIKNNETGLWQCPFCLKKDFLELSEVWNHFDAQSCPGKAVGIRLRLDNGISGYIHIKNLSNQRVENPEDRVRVGQVISCRVTKIDVERFGSECTSKSSDLADVNNTFRPAKDSYYDNEAEEEDTRLAEESQKKNKSRVYARRVIVHPSFHNITFAEAEKMMQTMDQGDCVIRPSSKGTNRLSITWKIVDDIYQHVDVVEEDKENAYSLGRSLYIGAEKFDDLDEIIARYINVMAAYVAEVLKFKYYCSDVYGEKPKAEAILKEQKKANPRSIPYIFSAAKSHPGKFVLSYIPRNRCYHEYFSVTTEGFKYRNKKFDGLEALIRWFKQHFREPIVQPQRSTYYDSTPINTPSEFRFMVA